MTKIIAHRGDASTNPENTLSSFQAALDNGAPAVELDVHLTNDGNLVVHHDYYLGNPDNGQGVIPNVNLAYIQTLVINETEHIPTLKEVFEVFSSGLQYEIELKGYTEDFINKVVSLAREYGVINQIEFTSPHHYVLTRLKAIEPSCRVGMFVQPLPGWMDLQLGQTLAINNALLGSIDVLHCPVTLLSKEFVDKAHSLNLGVHAADCDNDTDIDQALAAGVDQLSTNNLSLALKKAA